MWNVSGSWTGLLQYVFYESVRNLDFLSCYKGKKERYSSLILKFAWVLASWKRVSYWEMSGNLSNSVTYSILKRKMHRIPMSCEVALQVLWPAERGETFHQKRWGGSQNIACQIWPCIRLSSDSEIIRGPSPRFLVWREFLLVPRSVSSTCTTLEPLHEVLCKEI